MNERNVSKIIDENKLQTLSDYLKECKSSYVIIGGTATTMLLNEFGISSRSTKDIDMIIFKDDNDKLFSRQFNQFLKTGGYQNYCKDGKSHLYRFLNPKKENYPYMIELFAKNELEIDSNLLTPIKYDNDYYNLSGIVLNTEYFNFLKSSIKIVNNLPILNFTHIIPLKMYAYNNLTRDKISGLHIKTSDIKKHMQDIISLSELFIGTEKVELSNYIYEQYLLFMKDFKHEIKNLLENIYTKLK